MHDTGTAHGHGHDAGHGGHAPQGFLRTWVFSVDHKVIGIQYAVTGLLFLLFGFGLMMVMRWQLAFPGEPLAWLGAIL
jgi:cytochrome c oxidase subunit 1